MVNASVAGIRGPAKRAAFGDVTNMSRTGGLVNNDKKLVKMRSSAALLHTQPVATLNKENVPFSRKEAFLRPAQRSAALSTKPQPLSEISIPEVATEPAAVIVEESVVATSSSNINTSEPLDAVMVPSEDSLEVLKPSGAASSLQPRHYKSQPYLKAEQPTLRRTQSRQLETSQTQLEEGINRLPLIPLVEQQASAPESEVAASGMPLIESPADGEPVFPADAIPTSDNALEVLAKFTETSSEEVASSIALPKDVTVPQSEPEEYWDDEDCEDYDDQDQGYTTAHSFKSRDLTSGGATTVLMPRLTSRVQRELEEAKIEVDRTRSRDDIEEELWDVSMVAEYGEEIFEYMRDLEVSSNERCRDFIG
jgi:G2/mitotic-specific cyclin 3/4